MISTAYILGAGPCGLALTHELSRKGVRTVLIEASPEPGGLAKTFDWGASQTETGPHKLFSLDTDLVEKVRALLPDAEWLSHPKKSAIYLKGRLLNYPPAPLELVKALGLGKSFRGGWDLVLARALGKPQGGAGQDTFQSDALRRVGGTFYRELFGPIAWKVWGDPATLDGELSRSRIQVPSILGSKKQWQADEYFYPRGGLRRLWQAMITSIQKNGGDVVFSDPVTEIGLQGPGRVSTLKSAGGRRWTLDPEKDWVLSTIPLAPLVRAMGSVRAPVEQSISRLRLNDLLLVFLKVREDLLGKNAWIFVPDARIPFHRVSSQHAFDPGMVEKGVFLLCCEVMQIGNGTASDERVMGQCVEGLGRMGLLKDSTQVVDRKMIRLKSSYPVLTAGYRADLKVALEYFDSFTNLRTIGRQGSYNYIGSLDAMDTGFGTAGQMTEGEFNPTKWSKERARTSAYPILD